MYIVQGDKLFDVQDLFSVIDNLMLMLTDLMMNLLRFKFFPSMIFLRRSRKKSKYRWFKVVRFGGGGWVGSKKSVTCPVSQRKLRVILRKTVVAM